MEKIMEMAKICHYVLNEQSVEKNIEYRLLRYVAKLDLDGKVLLFNTLTREMFSMDPFEFQEAMQNANSDSFETLVKSRFLVPLDFDDLKFKNQIFDLHKTFDTSKGITHYIIMPTMACNARCFYCFEHGSKRYPMTDKIALDTANYIIKNALGQKIKIQWFGGEPLFNSKAIDIISDRLIEKKQDFSSIMISNGYLFDKTTVEKAVLNWKLQSVQITIDGTEKIYNNVKSYIYKNDISPFKIVLNNIRLLLNYEIKVIVRLNMDKHNEKDLYNLVDILYDNFKDNRENFCIYVWLLYDNRGVNKTIRDDEERHQLTASLLELENYIHEKGLGTKSLPDNDIKTGACLGDSKKSLVVLPDGHLGKCDHHSDDEFVGSIYGDSFDQETIKRWSEHRKPVELCKECPLVPECHRLKLCPDDGAYDCDKFLQKQRLRKLYRQMENAYDKFKEKF